MGVDAGKCVDVQWVCVEVLLNGICFNERRRPLIKNKCQIVDVESMRGKIRKT